MTISSAIARVTFSCDGSSSIFPVSMQAYAGSDFLVILDSAAGGTSLVLNSDYSMAPSGTLQPPLWTMQTTLTYPPGDKLQVILNPTQTQLTQYVQGQAFPSSAVQTNLDRVTQMVLRLQDQVGRSIIVPDIDVSPVMQLPSAAVRANGALVFDASGNSEIGIPVTGTISTSILAPFVGLQQTAAEAGLVITNLTYQPGDIRRYGALTTTADNTISIQSAINQALAGGYPVRVPSGTWNYASGLSVTGPIQIIGDDMYTAILRKTANVVGMTISDGIAPAQVTLEGFSLSSAGSDTLGGLVINTAGRPDCRKLLVTGHGSHGVELVQCSVGRFDNISSVSNGTVSNPADGIRLTGSGAVQANANTFTNIDTRGNTGFGMNFLNANANMGTGITTQSNTLGGLQFGACFNNNITAYSESNTGPDVTFTAACVAPNFGGNSVALTLVSSGIVFNGASAAVNSVSTARNGTVLQPGNSQLISDVFVLPVTNTQGVAVTGSFAWSHTINGEADFTINNLAASGITNFKNAAGGANLHIVGVDNLRLNAAAVNPGTGVALGSTTATSVGAAGGASAPPATPLGYLIANVAGTQVKIPYYNN